MSLETALRATEILLALVLIQQSAEHLAGRRWEQVVFGLRIFFASLLLFGVALSQTYVALMILALISLHRFAGPYNGGADRMGLLMLFVLAGCHFTPAHWNELIFGYLAIQLVLSYFISGWVKVVNKDWRSGRALRDVFQFSAYPVAENLRMLSDRRRLLFVGSWAVMALELLFPLALISQPTLIAALILAACFHLANALLLGLNRFFWTWLAAYPALLWLQHRLETGAQAL